MIAWYCLELDTNLELVLAGLGGGRGVEEVDGENL